MLAGWCVVAMVAASWAAAHACSCQPTHPQTHFCNADFVIVGRVQKIIRGGDQRYYDVHKVRIRNTLKATPKAIEALKAGRILTPSIDSLCGVQLQHRETYVLAGHISQLQAHVTLCDLVLKWKEVTPRQRKGFRLLYKQGCTCKVHVSFNGRRRRPVSRNTCVSGWDDCYERHGICLHAHSGNCGWTRAPRLTRCLQMQRFNGTMT